jgi:uncharacterized protein (TIGR03790 family)
MAAWAALTPGQIAVIANSNSPESLAVASYYAKRRRIPSDHIVKLNLPVEESMSRNEYERDLVAPLRKALETARLASSVRALVTVYGVPLRVEAPVFTTEDKLIRVNTADRLAAARSRLLDVERKARTLAGAVNSAKLLPPAVESGVIDYERRVSWLMQVDRNVQECISRVKGLRDEDLSRWYGELEAIVGLHQGLAGVTELRHDFSLDPLPSSRGDVPRARALHAEGMRLLLGGLRLPIHGRRDDLYGQIQQVYGAYGVFALAAMELSRLSPEQGDAGVDSELSLLWWDRDVYGASWRQANPLFHGNQDPSHGSHKRIPVMMVSRLDGPTGEIASRLVDRAMEAEQQGLQGTVYLDARGMAPKNQADTYGRFDQSLRDLDKFLRQHTTYRAKLENTEARFDRPGQAPDVMLYIGWYRLRHYEDAFVFHTGAIGYHMASAEAVSVRRPGEKGWCKNALERGVTATLGSVGEPYLDAFPEPLEFSALLMTGRYSLVEAYYLTSRWISWRMVLFGDPLYNPWKDRPALPRSALSMFPLAPIAPSDRDFDDPIQARDHVRLAHEQARARLDVILRHETTGPGSSAAS